MTEEEGTIKKYFSVHLEIANGGAFSGALLFASFLLFVNPSPRPDERNLYI